MHILVTTDGKIDSATVTKFCAPLAGADGEITVLTVVEVPRAMLSELRDSFSDQQPPNLLRTETDTVAITPPTTPPRSWPGDDAIIDQYLESKLEQRCEPIVTALRAAGANATSKVLEGLAARRILDHAREQNVDLIVVGSHGAGLFEGFLGSTGTKVTRLAKRPVLLLRTDVSAKTSD